MGLLKRWKENRLQRESYIRKQLNKRITESVEIQKKRMDNRKDIINTVMENRRGIGLCPLYAQSDQSILELERDPNDIPNEPFNWPRGTVRGMLAIFVTLGFLLITMIIMFTLNIPLEMIFEMWKILAGVFGLVVASYFWTRMKMGRPGGLGGMFV